MSVLEAVEVVLTEAGEPLHYFEVTKRILQKGLWESDSKTPEATVNSRLAVDIKGKNHLSTFQRTDRGIFALRSWGLPEFSTESEESDTSDSHEGKLEARESKSLTFTDAAEFILDRFAKKKPMHYRDITKRALELGQLKTSGLTPEATLYAQVLNEISRQTLRGETPRFARYGRGYLGLSRWLPEGIPLQIEQHNSDVRKKLHSQLLLMHPNAFEELIDELLGRLGFVEIEKTSYSSDGGIDVRGTLVVGDVIRMRMAVQVKRWKNNVQKPIVQQVRGSLGTHEQGLIVTTSDYSEGAREEAERPNAVPVALMNGEQLVALLIEYDIGVHHTRYTLIDLGENKEE